MRHTLFVTALTLLTAAFAIAGPSNSFVAADLGISIEPPIVKNDTAQNLQVAMFFLPVSDNFAANVNIQKQQYPDSIRAFDKLTVDQFKQFNLTVVQHTVKGREARYEYTGEMKGRKLHWYARAIKSGKSVFLATATALESHWAKQKRTLVRSLDSFSVK